MNVTSSRKIAVDKTQQREFYLLDAPTLDLVPLNNINTEQFTCFCAMDSTNIPVSTISDFCKRLLKAGCIYFCSWGPGCERVHDIMDEVVVALDVIDKDPIDYSDVMTTWHKDDLLAEAIYFFVWCVTPCDLLHAEPRNAVLISIDSATLPSEIETNLVHEVKMFTEGR